MAKISKTNPALSPEQLAALRLRCQRDLYFLAKEVLGYSKMVPHVHQRLCDTYVQKNPDVAIEDLDPCKTRMILAPRGTFKTSIDVADIVQWILCYPDIRILILTGSDRLATRILGEIKAHFQTNDTLRKLFPECCPEKNTKWGSEEDFTVPSRTKILREPTVSVSTIGSVKAGSHYEVLKPDDVVNEINSSTPEQCAKVIDAYDALDPLLEPGGYTDINGTVYKPWDLYAKLRERATAALKEDTEAFESGEESDVPVLELKVLILAAWTVKPGVVLSKNESGISIVRKDDVDLLFPERLKFRALYKKYRSNPIHFCCQYLNDSNAGESVERPFTELLIKQHIIPFDQIPFESDGEDFILWDLAGANPAKAATADFCVGIVGRLSAGKLHIIDMTRGKWTANQQAAHIVELQKAWPSAKFTYIEDAQGTRYLEPTIVQLATNCGVPIRIRWAKVPRFAGAKRSRIDFLAQLFTANRLWLASYLKYNDALLSELISLNPEHDDCSDAIAILVRELGIGAVEITPEEDVKAQEAAAEKARQRSMWNAMFGEDATPAPAEEETYRAGRLGYGR